MISNSSFYCEPNAAACCVPLPVEVELLPGCLRQIVCFAVWFVCLFFFSPSFLNQIDALIWKQ